MAKKTILRKANTQEIANVNEEYINMAEWTGLNDSTNYTSVDQSSFSEADNVYVDDENELRNRPPIVSTQPFETIDVYNLKHNVYKKDIINMTGSDKPDNSETDSNNTITYFADNFKIIDILKVNNIVMYHLYDTNDDKYYLYFNYNGWCRCEVEATIEVHYINFTYIVFSPNNIFGFKYNYETGDWTYYESDTLVHIPTRNIIQGTTDTEYESDNVITSQYITRYILESDIYTDTIKLIGETVDVYINDKHYRLIWKIEYTYTLATKIGILTENMERVVINNNGIMLAYDSNKDYIYYSIDGTLWKQVACPNDVLDATYKSFALSEDGSTIWIVGNKFMEIDDTESDDEDATKNVVRVYYLIVSYETIGYDELLWQSIDVDISQEYKNLYVTDNLESDIVTIEDIYSKMTYPVYTIKAGTLLYATIKPIIHSAEDGVCVILLGSNILSVSKHMITQELTTDVDNPTKIYITSVEKQIDPPESIVINDEWTLNYTVDEEETSIELDVLKHAAPCIILINEYIPHSCISCDTLFCSDNTKTKREYIRGIVNVDEAAIDDNYLTYQYRLYNKPSGLDWWDTASNNYFLLRYYPNNIDNFDCILLYHYNKYCTLTYNIYYIDNNFICSLADGQYGLMTYIRTTATCFTNYAFNDNVNKIICYENLILDAYYKLQDNTLISICLGTNDDNDTLHDVRSIIKWTFNTDIDISDFVSNRNVESVLDYWTYRDNCISRPFSFVLESNECTDLTEDYISTIFILNHDTENPYVLTNYYCYRNAANEYFPIDDYILIPIGFCNGYIYYYYTNSLDIYSTNSSGQIYVDYVQNDGDTDYNYLLPQFAETFITTTVGIDNKIYQVNNTDEDDGLLYIPESSKVELTDTITGLIVFSQSLLGVFTAHTAYEYIYGTTDDEDDLTSYLEGYYYLIPTKLQLGNRADNDILLGFDGSTVYMPTILGLATLTYEYFVQTTEHVFNYISDNIYTLYKQWDTSPIKLEQFEHWVFMYRQDTPQIYVYDTRSQAWWMWTLPVVPTKIYYQDKTLYLLLDEQLYYLDFDNQSIYDYDGNPIHWKFTSQKLHFGYPTNYKHLTTLTVVTTQQTDSIKYNLKFKNYHNIYDSTTEDTIEYNIETLANCIKKVNFMKTNAIQFELSSDDDRPTPFVTSDIALKYRITEKIR